MNYQDFKNIIQNDIKAKENDLRQFLFVELAKLPTPTVQVNSNTLIERAVHIDKSYGDFDLSRLSYIPDRIKDDASKGRFNNKGEPHFYGTFTDLKNPSATRFYLAAEIDQTILGRQNKTFNFTASKWKTINGFPSILFIFDSVFCGNDLLKSAHDSYINSPVYLNLSGDQKELLKLITVELGKLKSANGYDITNIVFDYYKAKGFHSIIYPGVPGEYRGNNIAMTPMIFDKCFEFFMGAEFCLTQNGEHIVISVNYKIELDEKNNLKYSKFENEEMGDYMKIKK